MLSLTVTDTTEQTAAVFKALAEEGRAEGDPTRWQALETWLAASTSRVIVPFATELARLVPPVAVRLRRDFKTVLMLIRAHALLHQATRTKDSDGRVVATLDDYAAVRDLVADLVAAGVEATACWRCARRSVRSNTCSRRARRRSRRRHRRSTSSRQVGRLASGRRCSRPRLPAQPRRPESGGRLDLFSAIRCRARLSPRARGVARLHGCSGDRSPLPLLHGVR